MKMSENMARVHEWFEDYKAQRGEDKPSYEQYKDDLFTRFGCTVAYLERGSRALYDSWKPAQKRSWLVARLAELPDDSPLVKHMRLEINYAKTARVLCDWTDSWQVFSEQRDYPDLIENGQDARMYVLMMMVLTRTSNRTNQIKTHGLWICGPKGYGKSVITDFIAGISTRRKKIAGDAKGVGRFKCNNFQDVIIMDDVVAEQYRQQDYYQTINGLLDNTGVEVKIHSSTQSLYNKYVIMNSNDRMVDLEVEPPEPKEEGEVKQKRQVHPLRRRVFEVRVTEELPIEVAAEVGKLNGDDDYKDEGDKLMWRWYSMYSKFNKIEDVPKLKEMQQILDKQCELEYPDFVRKKSAVKVDSSE